MKNMKIRVRMILSYMIIVAFLVVSGVVSIIMLGQVGDNLQSFYDNQFQTSKNAMDGRRSVFMTRADIFAALLEDTEAETQTSMDSATADFNQLKEDIVAIKQTFVGDMSLLTTVDTEIAAAEKVLPTILNHCMEVTRGTMTTQEVVQEFKENYKPHMDTVRDKLNEVGEIAETNASAKVDEGMELARTADVLIIAIMCVSVVVSVILGLFISESVRKPVVEMQGVCKQMVAGNMEVAINYRSRDELGEMAENMRTMTESIKTIIKDISYCMGSLGEGDFTVTSQAAKSYVGDYSGIYEAFNKLRDTMNDTLSQIDVSADQVNSGGEQVSSSAQALAQGSTQQASSVEELAATINEISHQIETTAEHAKTAQSEDMKAHDQIQACSNHMDDLMKAMSLIDNKSKEISKVIKTIEDIAFQTNILALNAAVEAARAGSAGKGFAVVADEVRNLATKSQEASKSTGALIEETVKAVDEGTRISNETDAALREVVVSAQSVLDAVNLISTATEEQSNAVAQVTTGIDQISSVVQTNSATAEQSAAASEELSGQANLLKEMIGRFTLTRDDHSGGRSSSRRSSSDDAFAASGHYDYGDKY